MGRSILTPEEQRSIADAVAEAEERTGGEIATAVIAESDDYGFRELTVSVLAGAAVFSIAVLFSVPIERFLVTLFWSYRTWMLLAFAGTVSLLAGGVVYLLAQIPAIDRLIVSRTAMHDAVGKRARRHFMESGIYATRDRTGVLIFVSVLERRVELIADSGISERVSQDRWDTIVADLTGGIAAGNIGVALAEAVRAVGAVLGETVERRSDDTNELPDRPTELESGS